MYPYKCSYTLLTNTEGTDRHLSHGLAAREEQGGRRLYYNISCQGHVILADPWQGLLSSELCHFQLRINCIFAQLPVHHKKSFSILPSPAGMSLTKLPVGGNYDVMYKLFLLRESLVSDIPAWGREYRKAFLRCNH
jgi:hypothetical protein